MKLVFNDVGVFVWVDSSFVNMIIIVIVLGWKDFLLSFFNVKGLGVDFCDVFWSVDLEKNGLGSIVKDDKGCYWYYVEIGIKDGSICNGWVCEQDYLFV